MNKKKKKFLIMLKKDLLMSKKEIVSISMGLLVCFLIPALVTFLTIHRDDLSYYARILGISGLLSISLVFFWYIYSCFNTLSKEWRQNTGYTVMSLPVSPVNILLSKLLSQMLLLTFITVISLILAITTSFIYGIWVKLDIDVFKNMPAHIVDVLILLFYINTLGFIIFIITNLSVMLGRMFSRYRMIFSALSAFVVVWLYIRVSGITGNMLGMLKLPDIRAVTVLGIDSVNLAGLLGVILTGSAALALSVRILDKHIEID